MVTAPRDGQPAPDGPADRAASPARAVPTDDEEPSPDGVPGAAGPGATRAIG